MSLKKSQLLLPVYGDLKKLGSFLEFKISDFGYSLSSCYLCRPKFKGS